jgi:hypothetical protein
MDHKLIHFLTVGLIELQSYENVGHPDGFYHYIFERDNSRRYGSGNTVSLLSQKIFDFFYRI